MDRFFEVQDAIIKLHQNLTKFKKYKKATRKQKILELLELKSELKDTILKRNLPKEVILTLTKRYKHIRAIVNESVTILQGKSLENTAIDLSIPNENEEESDDEEQQEEEQEEEKEELEEESEFNSCSESEIESETEMANQKLDISLALKLVEKYNGEAPKLASFFEAIELLKDYSEGVAEAEILKFIKSRLTGPAHGAIANAISLDQAKNILKTKFAVKFSPQAIESEMTSMKQNKKNHYRIWTRHERTSGKACCCTCLQWHI